MGTTRNIRFVVLCKQNYQVKGRYSYKKLKIVLYYTNKNVFLFF